MARQAIRRSERKANMGRLIRWHNPGNEWRQVFLGSSRLACSTKVGDAGKDGVLFRMYLSLLELPFLSMRISSFSKRWDPRIGSRAESIVVNQYTSCRSYNIYKAFSSIFCSIFRMWAHLSMYGMFVGMPTLN